MRLIAFLFSFSCLTPQDRTVTFCSGQMSLARSSADFNIISQGVLFAMKKFHAAFLGLITGLLFSPADAAQHQEKEIMLPEMPHGRPRLLLNSTTGFHPLTEARNNRWGNALADRVVHDAHVLLSEKPVERVMEGRRLLAVSRNVLYRVITLSAAYHLTGERAFAARAAEEMCAAAWLHELPANAPSAMQGLHDPPKKCDAKYPH